jgi:4-hydroxy-3-methylbut-2-enyl diphosphate reductase
MRVIRARALGMCFGVRDALAALDGIAEPASVTVHGQLVHNEQIQSSLRLRGFHLTDEADRSDVPPTPDVVITAHGVSDRERARLSDAGKRLIDTTCPLVRRVHAAARQLQEAGYFVLVIGKRGHVEVQGIVGDLTKFAVVESAAEAGPYPASKLGIVCQSTTRPTDARRIRHAIEESNPGKDIRFVDTICQPTRDRQYAVYELVGKVDALVVVGGTNSNNTRQLAEMARERLVPVLQVQSARELDPAWFTGLAVVGLTAGTSTPDAVIDEVHAALEAVGG